MQKPGIDQIFGRNPSLLTQQNIAISENGDIRIFRSKKAKNKLD